MYPGGCKLLTLLFVFYFLSIAGNGAASRAVTADFYQRPQEWLPFQEKAREMGKAENDFKSYIGVNLSAKVDHRVTSPDLPPFMVSAGLLIDIGFLQDVPA